MIRPATLRDIPRAVELGIKYHAMTEHAGKVELNTKTFSYLLEHIINNDDALFLVVENKQGTVTGGLCASLEPFYFNFDAKKAQLLFWYAETATKENIKLWDMFELWAKHKGAAAISAGCNTSIMRDKFERFWIKKGFTPIEAQFIKWEVNA